MFRYTYIDPTVLSTAQSGGRVGRSSRTVGPKYHALCHVSESIKRDVQATVQHCIVHVYCTYI